MFLIIFCSFYLTCIIVKSLIVFTNFVFPYDSEPTYFNLTLPKTLDILLGNTVPEYCGNITVRTYGWSMASHTLSCGHRICKTSENGVGVKMLKS